MRVDITYRYSLHVCIHDVSFFSANSRVKCLHANCFSPKNSIHNLDKCNVLIKFNYFLRNTCSIFHSWRKIFKQLSRCFVIVFLPHVSVWTCMTGGCSWIGRYAIPSFYNQTYVTVYRLKWQKLIYILKSSLFSAISIYSILSTIK